MGEPLLKHPGLYTSLNIKKVPMLYNLLTQPTISSMLASFSEFLGGPPAGSLRVVDRFLG